MNEENTFKQIIGKHIRHKRQVMNITLEELASDINMDDKHLGRIERGEKSPGGLTLSKLLIRLQLNPDVYLNELAEAIDSNQK